jgi:hypothetical protein
MKMPIKSLMFIGMVALFATGCKKEEEYGNMTVKMTDAPGDYHEVNVDVKSVDVHTDHGGWISLSTQVGVYNLLDLQNNITTVLATGTHIPAGKVSQMRLLLGSNNSVMLRDSTIHALKIPSSEQSGIKINVNSVIPPGGIVTVTIDYDADKSVNMEGNGSYIMKPVIKVLSVQ